MTGFAALLRKELLEQWRTTRLPVVVAVFLLVGLSSPLLARFTPEILKAVASGQFQITLPTPTSADAYDQLAKNLGQFGALIAVLLAMGSVATEKEQGTAALILTKPAGRGAFLVAKLVAIATTLGVATAIAAAGAWFYTLVLFEPLPVAGFVAAAALQWLALVVYAAIISRQHADPIVARRRGPRGRRLHRARDPQHRAGDRALPADRPGRTGAWPGPGPARCRCRGSDDRVDRADLWPDRRGLAVVPSPGAVTPGDLEGPGLVRSLRRLAARRLRQSCSRVR